MCARMRVSTATGTAVIVSETADPEDGCVIGLSPSGEPFCEELMCDGFCGMLDPVVVDDDTTDYACCCGSGTAEGGHNGCGDNASGGRTKGE